MKDVIFTITANTRKVAKTKDFLGINGENLQDNIIVDFSDEFIDGYAYLEVDFGTSKGFIGMTKVEQHYVLPIQSSLLSVAGNIYCQVRIDAPVDANTMSVFKSEKFEIPVLEAINAEGTVPEEYPTWVENADLKLAEVDTALANMQSATSKPNILINSNFAINQRGQSSYNNTNAPNNHYTVDRWVHFNNGDYSLTPVAGGGLMVANTGDANTIDFTQKIENGAALYGGKQLTLSCRVEGIITSQTQTLYKGSSFGTPIINSNNVTVGYLYMQWVDNTNDTFKVWFNVNKGKSYTIDYVKLEVGSVATTYSPPLIAEELVKCQRYYQMFKANGTNSVYCGGFIRQTNLARGIMSLKNTMRVKPTLTYSGSLVFIAGNSSLAISQITNDASSTNDLETLLITLSNNGTIGQGGALAANNDNTAYLSFDAEIY